MDLPKNKKTDTGGFELVHRAKTEVQRPKGNMNINIAAEGNQISHLYCRGPPMADSYMIQSP